MRKIAIYIIYLIFLCTAFAFNSKAATTENITTEETTVDEKANNTKVDFSVKDIVIMLFFGGVIMWVYQTVPKDPAYSSTTFMDFLPFNRRRNRRKDNKPVNKTKSVDAVEDRNDDNELIESDGEENENRTSN